MSPLDFSVEELDKLLTLANDIEKNPEKYAPVSYTHLYLMHLISIWCLQSLTF